MGRCEYCGNVIPEGQTECPICGAKAKPDYQSEQFGQTGYQQAYQNHYQNPYQNQYQNQGNGYQSSDYTSMCHPMDIAQNKVFAVLSYIGILVLIPLFANQNSRYARFHTGQGLNLFVLTLLVNVVRRVSFGYFWLGGWSMMKLALGVCHLVLFILMIVGIINAATGQAKELPIIGKIHIISLF